MATTPNPVFGNTVKTEIIEQWPTSVLSFSSEYPDAGWKAKNIVGPPHIYPKYGDTRGTWAPAKPGGVDWIILKCDKVVQIQNFQFWETNCCGSVVRIQAGQLADPNGNTNTFDFQNQKPASTAETFAKDALNYIWVDLYNGVADTLSPVARIWEPKLKTTNIWTDTIRIDVDGCNYRSFVEIDAIKIFGKVSNLPAALAPSSLSAQLLQLYKTGDYADIIFVVEGTEIPAHRGIIVARCEVFRNIFKSATSNKIQINDISLGAFKSLLEFIYTDCLNILPEQIIELYSASKKYDIPKLKQLVINDFGSHLTISNIVTSTDYAFKVNAPELEQICRKYILNNLLAISKDSGYKLLPGSLLPASYVGMV